MEIKIKLLLLFCVIGVTAYAQNTQSPLRNLGDPAPPLRVKEWIKGTPVQNFEKGRVYVVEFWATWCRPCMASMHHLSDIAHKYKRKVSIIAIDVYEQKSTTAVKVKALVDSMGNQMNFDVATEDTNFTVHDWLKAWGEDDGIPKAFVVNSHGKVAWIGNPWDLHKILPKILNNSWNLQNEKEAAISQRKLNNYLDSLETDAGRKLSKYEGNYDTRDDLGNPDSVLLVINELVSKEPKLKYAPLIASFTFTALLKTNPHIAYEYGKEVIATPSYERQPSYHSIIGGIKDYAYKLNIPAEVYLLGAEAYSKEIDPYPELFDNPDVYNTISNWYWLGGNKSKAVKARRKAKKLIKNNLYGNSKIAVSK